VALVAALVVSFAVGGPAFADRATELKAREDFAAGRYDEALQLFAKLYAETLHPVYLRNIGRCHQNMREPQKAIDAFRDYLTKNKKIADDERTEIEGYIHEMEVLRDEQAKQAAVAEVPPVAPSPTAVPRPVAPSPTAVPAAVAPPPASSAPGITLASAPPAAVQESPIYAKWWFWTAVGVVVAGGVVGALALSGGRPPCPSGVLECK
jgi:hypothetical protein